MRHLITLVLLILPAPLVFAQSLSDQQAEDFIGSLEEVNAYTESLGEELREGILEEDIMPRLGEPFAPFTRSTAYLREEHADVHERMGEIVEGHGFPSLEEWATTGDQVALAYMALRMEGQDMPAVTPDMLEQVPEAMRPQMESVLAMMETVRQVPPEDVEAIRPFAMRLEQHFGMTER